VGVDCAGHVQQAFLEANSGRGASVRKPGTKILRDSHRYKFKPVGLENLYNLSSVFFKALTERDPFSPARKTRPAPQKARPGDLIIMKAPQEGHTLLVRQRRELSRAEWANYDNLANFAIAGDRVHALEVEASFGESTSGSGFTMKRRPGRRSGKRKLGLKQTH
jgi:hypothetical protein